MINRFRMQRRWQNDKWFKWYTLKMTTKNTTTVLIKNPQEIWKAECCKYRIMGSTKFHMSVNEHGNWIVSQWTWRKICSNDLNDDIFFLDNLHGKSIINDHVDDDNEEDDVDNDNLEYHNTTILKFDFIEVSSFVGLQGFIQAVSLTSIFLRKWRFQMLYFVKNDHKIILQWRWGVWRQCKLCDGSMTEP